VLALFDIDGTLVRTGGAGTRAIDAACAALHGLRDASAGVSFAGGTDPRIVSEIFTLRLGREPTTAEIDAILIAYLVHLERELATAPGFRVLPGVSEAIEACAAVGAAIGLATGNIAEGARLKLERAGIWHRFDFGGYASDSADRAELVECAIRRGEAHAGRRVARRDVLVIGDTPKDVAAARATGATAVAVATGGASREALAHAAPDVLLGTLDELPAWLGALRLGAGSP
jgi:phosphoglycolate phosphatase-like HAD superfamily hydrolase